MHFVHVVVEFGAVDEELDPGLVWMGFGVEDDGGVWVGWNFGDPGLEVSVP